MRISDWSSDVCSSDLTTLSVDDTAAVAATLQRRFPGIVAPKGEDICYATSNRPASVKAIAPACDLVLVTGAPNSSNSLRLVDVAARAGPPPRLLQRAGGTIFYWFTNFFTPRPHPGASRP